MKPFFIAFTAVVMLSGCQSLNGKKPEKTVTQLDERYKLARSYLESSRQLNKNENAKFDADSTKQALPARLQYIKPLFQARQGGSQLKDTSEQFSQKKELRINANGLALSEFLHYALGELLTVSYILDEGAKQENEKVTLILQEQISKRKLYHLTQDILAQHNYSIIKKDGVFYVLSMEQGKDNSNLIIGLGNKIEDVPNINGEILQFVPFTYGFNSSVSLLLKQFTGVTVVANPRQNAMFLQGSKEKIRKALEFLALIDKPNAYSRHIATLRLDFVNVEEVVADLTNLLTKEGINTGPGNKGESLAMIPIVKSNLLVVFSSDKSYIERVNYWLNKLDVAPQDDESRFFVYAPQYARAKDLGDSLSPLLGGGLGLSTSGQGNMSTNNASSSNTRSSGNSIGTSGRSGNKMIVDERSNTIIFNTTGSEYQSLLPIIQRLDILPKQVFLEVVIAEVTLKDDFKKGVEFAITSKSDGTLTNLGQFGLDEIGGLSYSLTGIDGSINMSLFQDNSLVNVLSRPSVVVRDGVEATMSVGTEIPVVGQTTTDPISGDRQTTSIQYRKTGIELGVTPTVNAQGVVIMEISQSISNTVDGGITVSDSPSIFDRAIKTEVVATSGQTIMLGGLISENKSTSNSRVPGFSDLPFLGHLFRADTDVVDKTELVVLVTPRIIEQSEDWIEIKEKFNQQLLNIDFNGKN